MEIYGILKALFDQIRTALNNITGNQSEKRRGEVPPENMQSRKREETGVFIGKIHVGNGRKYYIGKRANTDGNVLVVGGSGCGKTSCIAIQTLNYWNGKFFAIDIKGDLSRTVNLEFGKRIIVKADINVKKSSKISSVIVPPPTYLPGIIFTGETNNNLSEKIYPDTRKQYPTKIFSFADDRIDNIECSGYDPLYFILSDDPNNLVQNVRELVQAIIPMPYNVKDPFWITMAQNLLTAEFLYYIGLKEVDEESNPIEISFNDIIDHISSTPTQDIINSIKKSRNQNAIKFIQAFNSLDLTTDDKLLTGIAAEISAHTAPFATDARIKSAFSQRNDMLRWEDLEDHNVIMRLQEDKLEQWRGAITMMLTQLIRTLERRNEKYSKNYNSQPILLMLDEFARLGKLDVIQSAISTLRSKNVTICVIVQSIAQLDEVYGSNVRRIIVDNCQYKAILNVTDPENQKYFSDMIGTIDVRKKSFGCNMNIGYSTSITISGGLNYSTGLIREPIIFPADLKNLKDIILITPEGLSRVEKVPYYNNRQEDNDDTFQSALERICRENELRYKKG